MCARKIEEDCDLQIMKMQRVETLRNFHISNNASVYTDDKMFKVRHNIDMQNSQVL